MATREERARRGRREGSLFSKLATVLELRLVVDQLDEDDALAFALTCRDFRAATCLAGSAIARFGERGICTSVAGVWSSTARLRWAVGLGYEMNSEHFAQAAGMGHLEVLQWARANGCEWNWHTCAAAAEGGHLELLQWARANGCEWDWFTCSCACMDGHMEVLQWARANGCPWDTETCSTAARGRSSLRGDAPRASEGSSAACRSTLRHHRHRRGR